VLSALLSVLGEGAGLLQNEVEPGSGGQNEVEPGSGGQKGNYQLTPWVVDFLHSTEAS
jgi:hypothetical protein